MPYSHVWCGQFHLLPWKLMQSFCIAFSGAPQKYCYSALVKTYRNVPLISLNVSLPIYSPQVGFQWFLHRAPGEDGHWAKSESCCITPPCCLKKAKTSTWRRAPQPQMLASWQSKLLIPSCFRMLLKRGSPSRFCPETVWTVWLTKWLDCVTFWTEVDCEALLMLCCCYSTNVTNII